MKRTASILLVSMLATVAGCWQAAAVGSGTRRTETRPVEEFRRVEINGSAEVTITAGKLREVSVELDGNLLPLITVEVKNGALSIGNRAPYKSQKLLKVTIDVPELESATFNGSARAVIKGLQANSLRLVGNGSTEVTASGTAQRLEVEINGSGQANLKGLAAQEASVAINGSGSATVQATDALSAAISGSGEIAYAGKPKTLNKSIAGSGQVRPL